MKCRDAMIDLETMALKNDAAIVSIGVVMFEPGTAFVSKKTFYRELDWENQDRVKDRGTIKWWQDQCPKAKEALHGMDNLDDMLRELAEFLPKDVVVWGNGPTFDITKLEHAYDQHKIDIPWGFWNIRDCRTVVDMFNRRRGGIGATMPGKNNHHALEDAQNQAKQIGMMWRRLSLGIE